MTKNVDVEEIINERVRKEIESLETGCFVLAYKIGENVEALAMHKFPKAVSMMISREGIISLHLRFLSLEERIKSANQFDVKQ
jgi:hypothetical protein